VGAAPIGEYGIQSTAENIRDETERILFLISIGEWNTHSYWSWFGDIPILAAMTVLDSHQDPAKRTIQIQTVIQ